MKIEDSEDYALAGAALNWLAQLEDTGTRIPREVAAFVFELDLAVDDYRQIHYPLGGDPKVAAPLKRAPHEIAHEICEDSCRRWRLALETGLILGEVEDREHGPECRAAEVAIKRERGE